MNYNEENEKKGLLSGKGFYLMLAACLIAVGIAAWSAMSAINNYDSLLNGNSTSDNVYNSESDITENSEPNESKEEIKEESANVSVNSENYEKTESKESETKEENFVLPVKGNVIKGFSKDELQYSKTMGDMRLHTATDISAPVGTNVKAAAIGTVTDIAEDELYGNCITVEHGDLTVKYCGLEDIKVKVGSTVVAGTVLGVTAAIPIESADEPHIHLEAHNGSEAVDILEAMGFNE